MRTKKNQKIQVQIIIRIIKSKVGDIMKNFIMCFTEEIKDKLIKEGYELLNIIDNDNQKLYYFKNKINNKINFSKNEIVYTNKMLY